MKDKKGILGTIFFHSIIILIIAIFGFSTPLPLPEEEGILINFGTEQFGSGDTDPAYSVEEKATPEQQPDDIVPESDDAEEIITQDFEEAPAITEEKVVTEKPDEKDEEVLDTRSETTEEEAIQEVVEERKVNERALYKGRSTTDESSEEEGINEREGNQGSITGSTKSDNYAQGLSQGSGGIEFSLSGRNPLFLPKPKYEYQAEGKVVVEIRVDRNGNVIYARAGVKGSTTNDENLIKAASEAALKAKFDVKTDAPFTQTGTITYHFILQ